MLIVLTIVVFQIEYMIRKIIYFPDYYTYNVFSILLEDYCKMKNCMQFRSGDRAVTPVVSTILIVAIVLVFGTTVSAVALGLAADIRSPAPQAHFDFELDESAGDVTVTKAAGDTIDGDQLKFSGAAKTKTTYGGISEWAGKDVQAGNSATVSVTGGETLYLIWQSSNGDTEAILTQYDVPNDIGGQVVRGGGRRCVSPDNPRCSRR
jgi:FlaG/FlaF family flagellin (archaellin)